MRQETIKYLGIIIDKRLNFNAQIDYKTGKGIKLIHALSKSAKVNWGLRHDVLRMIYFGATLPILSYGTPVWVDSLQRKRNASKLRRIQRLTNIKIAKAYRTSHEALCVLTGIARYKRTGNHGKAVSHHPREKPRWLVWCTIELQEMAPPSYCYWPEK